MEVTNAGCHAIDRGNKIGFVKLLGYTGLIRALFLKRIAHNWSAVVRVSGKIPLTEVLIILECLGFSRTTL